jgi:hypothetical protein
MQLVDAAIMDNADALRALRRLIRHEVGGLIPGDLFAEAVDYVHQANEHLREIRTLRDYEGEEGEHGR